MANTVDDIASKAAGEATIDGIAAQVSKAYKVLHSEYRGVPIADVKGIPVGLREPGEGHSVAAPTGATSSPAW